MTTPAPQELPDLPLDDVERVLVLAAHPDDPEHGVGAAVARGTSEGRDVRHVLATHGEAGIAGLEPADSRVLREEQRASCAVVGVTSPELLDHPDGVLVEGPALRRDLAAAARRHRPCRRRDDHRRRGRPLGTRGRPPRGLRPAGQAPAAATASSTTCWNWPSCSGSSTVPSTRTVGVPVTRSSRAAVACVTHSR